MKPKSEWGPADYIASGATWGLALVCLFFFGAGVASSVGDQIRSWQHDISWNKRGIISCVNGHFEISNIDFGGEWSGPAIDFDAMTKNCVGVKDAKIQTYK